MKKMTKETLCTRFREHGFNIAEMKAGSVNYLTVKYPDESETNQVVAAIYGSLNHAASLWVKESAFAKIKPHLPADAVVEDVEPFKRGFQWSIHFEHNEDDVIDVAVAACVEAANERLTKTKARQELEAQRAIQRAEREKKRSETRRDWRSV